MRACARRASAVCVEIANGWAEVVTDRVNIVYYITFQHPDVKETSLFLSKDGSTAIPSPKTMPRMGDAVLMPRDAYACIPSASTGSAS